ncbi:hypothetical protein [Aeromonas enteropelogenes]|nr:hypothetical protein [Aeromonas enteropelogenes]MCZ0753061.1 hypothetical protein [Aeromonas enteropelogenes]
MIELLYGIDTINAKDFSERLIAGRSDNRMSGMVDAMSSWELARD